MKVFVSSTFRDLKNYRSVAKKAILRAGCEPILIEEAWGTTNPSGRKEQVLEMLTETVSKSDIFVQILGNSFGAIAQGTGKPWTIIENEIASKQDKKMLIYIVDEQQFKNDIDSKTLAIGFSSKIIRAIYSPDAFQIALRRDLSNILNKKQPDNSATGIILPSVDPSDFRALLSNPDELRKVSPRFFEEVIAELLKADGWSVELVKRHNAPGPDIIALSSKLIDNVPLKMVVECKRWREDRPVDIDVVRKVMYWVNEEYKSTFGMIATTSRFTSVAADKAKDCHQWRLSLKDYDQILSWLWQHCSE